MLRITLALLASVLLASCPASAEGWYATAFGGAHMAEDWGGDGGGGEFFVEPGTGYVVGAALGRHLGGGLRGEVELSYRSAETSGAYDAGCVGGPLTGADSTFAAMLNAAYDFDVGALKPYVMAGAGVGVRRLSLNPAPTNFAMNGGGADETGFAYQLGGGVNYALSPETSVGIGYRYFVGPSIERVAQYGKATTLFEAGGESHAFVASVTVALN